MSLAEQQNSSLLHGLHHEVMDIMDECLSAIDASSGGDNDVAIQHALLLCAERTELLGMSAATAGMMGMMDVCTLFSQSLQILANDYHKLTNEERQQLQAWAPLLVAYLTDPNDTVSAEILVAYLQELPGSSEMADIDLAVLRDLLIPEDIELNEALADEPDTAVVPEQILAQCCVPADQVIESEADVDDNITDIDNEDEQSTSEISEQGLELVGLVRMEIEATVAELTEALFIASSPDSSEQECAHTVQHYEELLVRFILAAETVGLDGLGLVLRHIHANLKQILADNRRLSDNERDLIDAWPWLTLEYLDSLKDQTSSEQLLTHVMKHEWPVPFDHSLAETLANQLMSPALTIDEEEVIQRQTEAQAEDVSLALPEDVVPQLLESLLQELPQHTADFTESISHLLSGKGTQQDVDKAQRIAHTLKGSANTVGITGIASLTHHIEDILQAFSKHASLPGHALADVLMNAADVLEMMSEYLLGQGPVPDHAQNVLQQVLHWANKIDLEGITEEDAADYNTDVDTSAVHQSESDNTATPHTDNTAAMLRIPAALVDDMLRLVSESMIMTAQLQDRLHQAILQARHVNEQNQVFQQLTYELEQLVDVRGVNLAQNTGIGNKSFDSLELDQYNELHTVTHRLVEAATDAREMTTGIEDQLTTLDDLLDNQERLHLESQDVVMRTRMVPVQNIIPRLQRCVRQTCRVTEKRVELEVAGAETLIDSDVLNELVDPIMHIIRNAIDHGIEHDEQRNMSGKDPVGHLLLSFAREGNQIVACCQDDGAGLNYTNILQTAVDKGLVDEDQEMTEEELAHLVLLPGFTTRNETTQTSGRGIGMDVVNKRIIDMKGSLLMESEQGQGCNIELRIPLTMISIHGLIVRLHNHVIAISNRGVEQIVHAGDGHVLNDGQSLSYHLDEEVYDAGSLEDLLNMPTDSTTEFQERPVLLVRNDNNTVRAVFVEQVLANQEMVVKQLGQYIPQVGGIEGTTILGDGSVVPVVDLPGLLRTASADLLAPYRAHMDSIDSTSNLPCALVVDDSLSARRALAESIKDAGYEVLTAKDGLEAIEVMEEKRPDILLVDLEMPRMNGLELTSHVRARETTRDIPIIMITSRSTEKHREQAASAGVDIYLTKPFDDGDLHEQIEMQLIRSSVRNQ